MLPAPATNTSAICPFQDNFTPFVDDTVVPAEHFSRLPDSDEYLALLEKKLKKVQSSSTTENRGKEILRSLGESRESCMLKFLTSESTVTPKETFEEFKVNPILCKLNPEKQALDAEELIQLVKSDQLALETNGEEEAAAPEQDHKEPSS